MLATGPDTKLPSELPGFRSMLASSPTPPPARLASPETGPTQEVPVIRKCRPGRMTWPAPVNRLESLPARTERVSKVKAEVRRKIAPTTKATLISLLLADLAGFFVRTALRFPANALIS